jgi:putative NIF3 family GTP cyclohydrolase 1 type 2
MKIKIKDVMDTLAPPNDPINGTVDLLNFGEPQAEVEGIVVTFMASQSVLSQAVELGANLIITHEGAFFSHRGSSDLVTSDPVFLAKKRFIDENELAIYRVHDYCHHYQPDLITDGLVSALGWQAYVEETLTAATIVTIPPMSVGQATSYIKNKLGLSYVRLMGDSSTTCSRIGVLVGYRGGLAMSLFAEYDLDLILYGEGPEWETPEYVRDAQYMGLNKSLVVVGHQESEQPGMKQLAEELKLKFPSVPLHYIASDSLFQLV